MVERILLRPNEAAEALGVSRSKLYSLLKAGAVPSVRVGSSLRVPVRALERLVETAASKEGDRE